MQDLYVTSAKIYENVDYVRYNSERDYVKCVQNLIERAPFGKVPFYIFTILKRIDYASGVKKFYHQPRLTKPEPVPGSTLLRVHPQDPGVAKIMWTLPVEESFNLFKHGKIFQDEFVNECCRKFLRDPALLTQPEDGDMSEQWIRDFYKQKSRQNNPEYKDRFQEKAIPGDIASDESGN